LFFTLVLGLPPALRAAGPPAPDITAQAWLNSEPLSMADLRGRVVLVEFWTFACFNCRNVEPYIREWHETYGDKGLVVIAVHSPEFDFEKKIDNVRDYVAERSIPYPVAVDNDFSTWRAYENRAWPTVYLVDKDGRLVYRQIGEGRYAETEARIRELLAETAGDS
jgi:thiol-disulfide isomerase/thioredoxin